MSAAHEELTAAAKAASPDAINASVPDVQFRSELAFPRLSDEMLQRTRSYGQEETVAGNTQLYTYGDRDTDMFVVLSGEIESRLLLDFIGKGEIEMLPLVICWRVQWGTQPAEYAENGRLGTHHTDEPLIANLQEKLAAADARRRRLGKHHCFRLHLAANWHDGRSVYGHYSPR